MLKRLKQVKAVSPYISSSSAYKEPLAFLLSLFAPGVHMGQKLSLALDCLKITSQME